MNLHPPFEKQFLTEADNQSFTMQSAALSELELADTMMGMANAGGGTIVVGIKDGQYEGFKGQDAAQMEAWLEKSISCCFPPVQAQTHWVRIDQSIESIESTESTESIESAESIDSPEQVLQIHVAGATEIHRNQAGLVFLRVGAQNIALTEEQQSRLAKDIVERARMAQGCPECREEDLDPNIVARLQHALDELAKASLASHDQQASDETDGPKDGFDDSLDEIYRWMATEGTKSFGSQPENGEIRSKPEPEAELPEVHLVEQLCRCGVAHATPEGWELNYTGVLLLAKNPQKYHSGPVIVFRQYSSKREDDEALPVYEQQIHGSLPHVLDTTVELIRDRLRVFCAIHPIKGRFITVPEYPHTAYVALVTNALQHAAYQQREPIYVSMYSDAMTIISPGLFPGIVDEANLYETQSWRNPALAHTLKLVMRAILPKASLKRVRLEMEQAILPAPTFEVKEGRVEVRLQNYAEQRRNRHQERMKLMIRSEWSSMTFDERRALEMIYNRKSLTPQELADRMKRTVNHARQLLNTLQARGLVDRIVLRRNDVNQVYKLLDI